MADDGYFSMMDVLDDEQRAALEALGTPMHFPPEQTIFWQGQPSRSVLIIQKGNVKVTSQTPEGKEMILAIRGPGEIMGDEGVLMDQPRSATVTTINDVVGLDISADALVDFVDEHKLWRVMYRAAVGRRRQSDQRALLAKLDVKNRLARCLLELAAEVGEESPDGLVIDAAMSQADFAGRIGASRDAVAIEFRKFRELGLVSTFRRRIVLHDLEGLRRISSA